MCNLQEEAFIAWLAVCRILLKAPIDKLASLLSCTVTERIGALA